MESSPAGARSPVSLMSSTLPRNQMTRGSTTSRKPKASRSALGVGAGHGHAYAAAKHGRATRRLTRRDAGTRFAAHGDDERESRGETQR
jgi:hypothetical protein